MEPPRTQEDLEQLIALNVEENLHLDYKGAGSLDRKEVKKKEITKDVSAMANSAGGMIIYGIREHSEPGMQQLPSHLDPVDSQAYSREWLDSIIGQIQPTIEGLEIIPIPVTTADASGYCYVVVIPQSQTAHQANDYRYYRRRNFLSEPIDDYEIRELMSRARQPVLTVNAKYILDVVAPDGSGKISSHIVFQIRNKSNVMARHYAIVGKIPTRLPDGEIIRPEKAYLAEERGRSFWFFKVANATNPIFPGETVVKNIELQRRIQGERGFLPTGSTVYLTIYADNSQAVHRRIPLEAALKGWV